LQVVGMKTAMTAEADSAEWFWALNAITGTDPVPAGSTFQEAAEAWLKWGRERGYL